MTALIRTNREWDTLQIDIGAYLLEIENEGDKSRDFFILKEVRYFQAVYKHCPDKRQSLDEARLNARKYLDSSEGNRVPVINYFRWLLMTKFSKEEQQKKGKVYTPQEIVDWIHTRLIEQSPLSLYKTYCDFACGTGHFVLNWYGLLIEHWRQNKEQYPKIQDEHAAHKHIVEKCLFFADIDPFAVRMCKLGLFLMDRLVPNLIFNSFEGDSLLDRPFVNNKFDYVAGNPPYVVVARKDEKRTLYQKTFPKWSLSNLYKMFVVLAFDSLKENGKMGMIFPMSWLSAPRGDGVRDFIADKITLLHSIAEGVKAFPGITQATSIVIMEKKKEVTTLQVGRFCNLSSGEVLHLNSIRDIQLKNDTIFIPTNVECKALIQKIDAFSPLKRMIEFRTGEVNSTSQKSYFSSSGGIPSVSGRMMTKPYFLDMSRVSRYYLNEVSKESKIIIKRLGNNGAHNIGYGWLRGSMAEKVATDANYCSFAPVIKIKREKSILALLNSRVLNYYYSILNDSNTLSPTRLNDLPVPNLGEDVQEQLSSLVDAMFLNPDDSEVQSKIDKIVYGLYGLTDEERKIVESHV